MNRMLWKAVLAGSCTMTLQLGCAVETGVQVSNEVGVVGQALTAAEREQACAANDARVQLGLVDAKICAGADIFFRETFGGNGRQCGSCHRAEDNFTISPQFIQGLPSSDPLLSAAQNIPGLEVPDLLEDFALVLENVDGTDDLPNKFTMRAIPHTLSLATSLRPSPGDGTTGPQERTGWSGDGAPVVTLQDNTMLNGDLFAFLAGAIAQHYPLDVARDPGTHFVEPTLEELDATEAFQLSLGRTNELKLTTNTPNDPDLVVLSDSEAQAGLQVFVNKGCNGCHHNAGANFIGDGNNRNFDTDIEDVRLAAVDNHVAPTVPGDGGFGLLDNLDGTFGDGGFNTPSLVEAADTGPFFHTNAFATIEDAVGFYNSSTFNGSPAAFVQINLNPTEIAQIGRFLRVINIAFNLQIALQRLGAAATIIEARGNDALAVENDLLELAAFELEDAFQVSADAPAQVLPQGMQSKVQTAQQKALQAASQNTPQARLNNLNVAMSFADEVNASLGSGLGFVLGEGNLMR